MLRCGKVALSNDTVIVRVFKTGFETLASVPLDDYCRRVTVAHDVFSHIKDNIGTIANPSFDPSASFLQTELPELMKALRKEFRDGWYYYLRTPGSHQVYAKVLEFSELTNKINAALPNPRRDMRDSLFTFP